MKYLVLGLILFSLNVLAAPLETYTGVVPANTNLKKVEQAIIDSAKGRKWIPKSIQPGKIELYLHVRSHTVTVDVSYDKNSYTFSYKDSLNMDYNSTKKTIHAKYGKWIRLLIKDIDGRLLSAE